MTRRCGIIITNQPINHPVRLFDGLCVFAVSPQEKNHPASILFEVHWAISQPRTKTFSTRCTQMKLGRGRKYRKRFIFMSETKAVRCSGSSVWTPSLWLGIWPAHNVQTVNSWKGGLRGGWGLWRLRPCKFSRAHSEAKGPHHPTKKTRPQPNSRRGRHKALSRVRGAPVTGWGTCSGFLWRWTDWRADGPGGFRQNTSGLQAPGSRLQAPQLLVGAPATLLLLLLRLASLFLTFFHTQEHQLLTTYVNW